MSDTFLGNPFNNGPTPNNPWADYMASRAGRKHEERMENTRHERNVEMAGLQHQNAQDRDRQNYKRGKKEAGRDRAHETSMREGTEAHEVGQTIRSQQFKNEQERLARIESDAEAGRGREATASAAALDREQASKESRKAGKRNRNSEKRRYKHEASQSYLDRVFKSSDRAAAAADTINQTRETASQGRRTVKANANVARDQSAPTPVGNQTMNSLSANENGFQVNYGAPTPGPSNGGGDSGGGPPTPPASDGAPTAPKPRTARTPEQETRYQAKLAREQESRKLANDARKNAKNTGTEVTPASTEVKPAPKKKSGKESGKNPAELSSGKTPAKMSTASPAKPQGWSRTKKGLVLLAAAALVPK